MDFNEVLRIMTEDVDATETILAQLAEDVKFQGFMPGVLAQEIFSKAGSEMTHMQNVKKMIIIFLT